MMDNGGGGEIIGIDLGQFWELFLLLVCLCEVKGTRPRRLEPLQVVSH